MGMGRRRHDRLQLLTPWVRAGPGSTGTGQVDLSRAPVFENVPRGASAAATPISLFRWLPLLQTLIARRRCDQVVRTD